MNAWNASRTKNEQGADFREVRVSGKVSELQFTIKPKSSFWRAGFKLVDPNGSILPLRNGNSLLFHLGSTSSDDEYGFTAYLNGELIVNLNKINRYPPSKSLTIKLEINHNNFLRVYVNGSLEFKPAWHLEHPDIREKVVLIAWGDENEYSVDFKNISAVNWKNVQTKTQKQRRTYSSPLDSRAIQNELVHKSKNPWFKNPGVWALIIAFISIPWWPQALKLINHSEIPSSISTVTKDTNIYNPLVKLSPHMNISYFMDVLGKPAIFKTNEDGLVKYFTFIDPRFYLLATTDKDDSVIYFAVTSRKSDFQPTFKRPDDYNNTFKNITLNKTVFTDVDNPQDFGKPRCFYTSGVRRFWYSEGYYEANPGNYQSFYIGINDAGYINPEVLNNLPSFENQVRLDEENGCNKIPITFREKATVNTYIVTDAFKFMPDSTESAKLIFGVDSDEVRVINQ